MCVLYIQLYPAKKPWASQHQRSLQLDNDHAHICKTKWRSIWQLMSDRLSFKSRGYLFDIDRVMSVKVRPSVQLLVLNVILTFTSYTDRFKMHGCRIKCSIPLAKLWASRIYYSSFNLHRESYLRFQLKTALSPSIIPAVLGLCKQTTHFFLLDEYLFNLIKLIFAPLHELIYKLFPWGYHCEMRNTLQY